MCGLWVLKVRDRDDLSVEEWRTVFKQMRSLDLAGDRWRAFVERTLSIFSSCPRRGRPLHPAAHHQRNVDASVGRGHSRSGLPNSAISLMDFKTHNNMRGEWDKNNQSVDAGRRDKYGFKFGINFAVTDNSVDELERMIEYAESKGADLIPANVIHLVGTIPEEKQPASSWWTMRA